MSDTRLADTCPGWTCPVAAVLAVACVCLLLMDMLDLSLFRGSVDPTRSGNLADWAQALVTGTTVLAAGMAIRNDRRIADATRRTVAQLSADERRAEEARLERSVRQQASQLFAWVGQDKSPIVGIDRGQVLHIMNKSGAPVFDWMISNVGGRVITSSDEGCHPLLPGETSIPIPHVENSEPQDLITLRFVAFNGETLERTGATVTVILENPVEE